MQNLSWCLLAVAALCGGVRSATVRQVTWPVEHAEGPHWSVEQQLLYYVDISQHLLLRWDPAELNEFNESLVVRKIDVGGEIGFSIPVAGPPGRFIAGVDRNLVYVNWTGDANATTSVGQLEVIEVVDTGADQTANRFNDAKADATGRLWAGTMGGEPNGVIDPFKGSLYSLDTRATLVLRQVSEVSISNGIAWNKAGNIMYYIDTPKGTVDAFDFFLEAGIISSRRTVFDLSVVGVQGGPDGMTIDSDDNLWVALYGGSAIIQIDPRVPNTLLQKIDIPANQVTSVTFGGPTFETLFVTTSRRGLSDDQLISQPLAGSVFAVEDLGVQGLPGNSVVRNV